MYAINNHDEETERLKQSILARLEVRIQETLKKPLKEPQNQGVIEAAGEYNIIADSSSNSNNNTTKEGTPELTPTSLPLGQKGESLQALTPASPSADSH